MDIKQIDKLAKLSKLPISKHQATQYSKDISMILDYVGQLNDIDTKSVEPMNHAVGIKDIVRQDEHIKSNLKLNQRFFKTGKIL